MILQCDSTSCNILQSRRRSCHHTYTDNQALHATGRNSFSAHRWRALDRVRDSGPWQREHQEVQLWDVVHVLLSCSWYISLRFFGMNCKLFTSLQISEIKPFWEDSLTILPFGLTLEFTILFWKPSSCLKSACSCMQFQGKYHDGLLRCQPGCSPVSNHCFTLKAILLFFTRVDRWSLQLQEFHLCFPALSTFPLPPQIDTSGDVFSHKEPLWLHRRLLHLQTSTPGSLDPIALGNCQEKQPTETITKKAKYNY